MESGLDDEIIADWQDCQGKTNKELCKNSRLPSQSNQVEWQQDDRVDLQHTKTVEDPGKETVAFPCQIRRQQEGSD